MPSEDVIEITQLVHRYCHALDAGDVDAVVACFAPDAVLAPVYEGPAVHTGHDAVRAWYSAYDANRRERLRHLRHRVTSTFIDVDGDEAQGRAYLDADWVSPSGAVWTSIGHYEDRFVRRDGRWAFAHRAIHIHASYKTGEPRRAER